MVRNTKTLISLVLLNLVILVTSNNSLDSDRAQPDLTKSYEACNGEQENSIDIHDASANYSSHLKPFSFINFDETIWWTITKNTQNVPIFVPKNISLAVNGSNFNDTYSLFKFYFVWGVTDNEGSRYMIDGTKFPLELRLVLTSPSKMFSVIVFVFSRSEEDNPALKDILDIIHKYRSNSNLTNTDYEFKLSTFLPSLSKPLDYYRYDGDSSCEGFTWSIMEQSMQISLKQLSVFRESQTTKINRHVEKLVSQKIYSSRKDRRQTKTDVKTSIITAASGVTINSFSFSLFFIPFSFKLFF